jgi:hypothetical protein
MKFQPLDLAALEKKQLLHDEEKSTFIVDAPGDWRPRKTDEGVCKRGVFGSFVRPPSFDYLTMGLCYDPELHPMVQQFVYGDHRFGRFTFRKQSIRFDDTTIGAIKFSNGISTRYGRKVLIHFTGDFFRKGLPLGLINGLRNEFEDAVYQRFAEMDSPQWVRMTTVERLDLAMELNKKEYPILGRSLQPFEVLELFYGLPGGMGWREGTFSGDGQTAYASESSKAMKNRGKKPLLRFYSKVEDDTFRVEVEFPQPQTAEVNTIEECTRKAADLFSFFLPGVSFELGHPMDPERTEQGAWRVPVWDTSLNARPDDFSRLPFGGHAPRELARLTAQGSTVLKNSLISQMTCRLLARLDVDRQREALYSNLSPEEVAQVEACEVGGIPWTLADGVDWDDVRQDFPSRSLGVEDAASAEPLAVEDIYELHNVLDAYRQFIYPGSPRFEHSFAESLVFDGLNDPHAWVKKLLLPKSTIVHDHSGWVLHEGRCEGEYYLEHEHTNERLYVDSERAKRARMSPHGRNAVASLDHEEGMTPQARASWVSDLSSSDDEFLTYEQALDRDAVLADELQARYRVKSSGKAEKKYRLDAAESRKLELDHKTRVRPNQD